ncbi:hypothetical protein SAMN05421785_103361 [Chryseobacterium gambrini]|uniref:Uncharacterized protein n=1 Tax=Chryseobacterium gambrini TaxID=373672 RepID=A0A1N7MNN5_9FLAO|nr:hypothetical protein SAMN05421785_103361 [Chryseobacterium gambrini]
MKRKVILLIVISLIYIAVQVSINTFNSKNKNDVNFKKDSDRNITDNSSW